MAAVGVPLPVEVVLEDDEAPGRPLLRERGLGDGDRLAHRRLLRAPVSGGLEAAKALRRGPLQQAHVGRVEAGDLEVQEQAIGEELAALVVERGSGAAGCCRSAEATTWKQPSCVGVGPPGVAGTKPSAYLRLPGRQCVDLFAAPGVATLMGATSASPAAARTAPSEGATRPVGVVVAGARAKARGATREGGEAREAQDRDRRRHEGRHLAQGPGVVTRTVVVSRSLGHHGANRKSSGCTVAGRGGACKLSGAVDILRRKGKEKRKRERRKTRGPSGDAQLEWTRRLLSSSYLFVLSCGDRRD